MKLPDVLPVPEIRGILLIVEDNLDLRESLVDILSLEGYDIFAAANGLEALNILESIQPDLILSDINMPHMDGISLYRVVRHHADWQTIPFVFLTAFSIKYEVAAAHELRRESVLVKPVDFDLLLNTIRDRLEA